MKNVTKANVMFTFMVAFYIFLIFVVRLIPTAWIGYNMRSLIPEMAMFLPAIIYVTYLRPKGLGEIHYKIPSVINCFGIVIMTLCLVPAVALISGLSALFSENIITDVFNPMLNNPMWLSIILMALVPAVCEEYLFRGLLFHNYRRRNPFRAMLLSSLLFGLLHLNLQQFFYAFFMGCVLCVLVCATDSVLASMMAHFVFNAFNVMQAYKNADKIVEDVGAITAVDYIVYFALIALGVVAAFFIIKRIAINAGRLENVKLMFIKEKRREYVVEEGRFADVYLLTGVVICALYMCFF